MSTEKHIDLEHLKLVLFCRRLKTLEGKRYAAMSEGHDVMLADACPQRPYSDFLKSRLKTPPMFMPMQRTSVPAKLVERVRMVHGLPEVKRTWGVGYKAMLAETAGWPS